MSSQVVAAVDAEAAFAADVAARGERAKRDQRKNRGIEGHQVLYNQQILNLLLMNGTMMLLVQM